MPIPREFDESLSEDVYNKLIRKTQADEAGAVGTARSEALARGLEGSAFESSGVNSARAAGTQARSDIGTNLAMQLAGYGREERLGREKRGYQVEDRDFAAGEAEKDRAFRERIANLDYERSQGASKDALKGQVFGSVGSAVGMIGGSLAGNPMVGSWLGGMLGKKLSTVGGGGSNVTGPSAPSWGTKSDTLQMPKKYNLGRNGTSLGY